MNLSTFKKEQGFTLIETLFAIVIISIALVATTSALQNSLQTSFFVKNQITARYLAEDAMEYILAERDAGAATPQGWMNNLLQCVNTVETISNNVPEVWCTVNTFPNNTYSIVPYTNNGSITSSSLGTSTSPTVLTSETATPPLYACPELDGSGADATTTVFEQSSMSSTVIGAECTPTPFIRTVTIMPAQLLPGNAGGINQYNEMVVTVTVSWASGPFSSNESYTLSNDIYNWQPGS